MLPLEKIVLTCVLVNAHKLWPLFAILPSRSFIFRDLLGLPKLVAILLLILVWPFAYFFQEAAIIHRIWYSGLDILTFKKKKGIF